MCFFSLWFCPISIDNSGHPMSSYFCQVLAYSKMGEFCLFIWCSSIQQQPHLEHRRLFKTGKTAKTYTHSSSRICRMKSNLGIWIVISSRIWLLCYVGSPMSKSWFRLWNFSISSSSRQSGGLTRHRAVLVERRFIPPNSKNPNHFLIGCVLRSHTTSKVSLFPPCFWKNVRLEAL